MGIFDKFKKKKEEVKEEKIDSQPVSKEKEIKNENDIIEVSNYMLADVRKDDINDSLKISLDKLSTISPIAVSVADTIKNAVGQSKSSGNIYKITNLGKNDSLKALRDGKTFWGSIKKSGGSSTMAKLKEVNSTSIAELDPTMLMMTAALFSIEAELGEIKELNKKILSFLEYDKESEIEADLEVLKNSITDFKYNLENESYLANNHKQVMDIKRTANKNILFYKKEIEDDLSKDKLFTTSSSMNAILDEIEKKFKYYRLSLYIYAFSTYIEVFLTGNYKSEYLLYKRNELDELDKDYLNVFNKALEYIKKNADKSLEGNVLEGLGSASKVIGNLAKKVNVKNVDNWLNEKSDSLKESGKSLKDTFASKFDKMKETNSKVFINQIERIDGIYNKTKEIYFDKENVYLKMS